MVFQANFYTPVYIIFSPKCSVLLLKPWSPKMLYHLPNNIPFRLANHLLKFLFLPLLKSSLGLHLNLLNMCQAFPVLKTKSLFLFIHM